MTWRPAPELVCRVLQLTHDPVSVYCRLTPWRANTSRRYEATSFKKAGGGGGWCALSQEPPPLAHENLGTGSNSCHLEISPGADTAVATSQS